jgi:hypothetical protein
LPRNSISSVAVARVVHQRGVDVREEAGADQLDLAVPALLGRAPDDAHAPAQLGRHVAQREEGEIRGGPHEVVTARVAHARQRVVLAQDRDDRCAAPDLRGESRLETACAARDRSALAGQVVRESVGGESLLERELGSFVDPDREVVERGAARVDALRHARFELGGLHRWAEVSAKRALDAPTG